MRPKWRTGFVLLLLLFLVRETRAQSIGGAIIGQVHDASGALAQAEVRITNVATGQSRVWLTDDEGRYELREVPPGLYELRISKDGYTTFSTPPTNTLRLALAQVAKVEDITLAVAPVSETTKVEVHAMDVAMTDTNTATLGTAFDEKQVRELPLPARDVNNLALLAPGVASIGSFSFANTLVAFSADGSRGRDNNFIIDSVDNNEPVFGGAATQFTNTASFSEFHILTGQFQAEYGRNSGSIVNVISQQGGRDFHGSLFWFGQNDGVNAMTKVEKQSGLTKPARFYENQLGATLSGPIRRDSTWFFLSYQFDRARNDLSQEYPVVALMPTPDSIATLSKIPDPTPSLLSLLNDPLVKRIPGHNVPCPTRLIQPGAMGNDCFDTFTMVFGLPAPIEHDILFNFAGYYIPGVNVTDLHDHQAFGRIDQKFGQADNLFFRYFFDDFGIPLAPFDSPVEIGVSDNGLYPEWRNALADRTQNFGLAWTHSFTRALNEFRLAYSRISTRNGAPSTDNLPAQTVADKFLDGAFTLGRDTTASQLNNNVYQIQDNFSFIRGRHSIKLGANLNDTLSGLNQIPSDLGLYVYDEFEGIIDNAPLTGGRRFPNFEGHGGRVLPLRETAQFYFAQDDIHLSKSFILNIGLRYENYSPTFNAVVERSDTNEYSPPKIHRVYDSLAPRVGFAWGIDSRTVLRGGYGIFYNPTFFDIALLAWQSSPISPFVSGGGDEPVLPRGTGLFPNPVFTAAELTTPVGNQGCTGTLPPGTQLVSPLDCATQTTVSRSLRNPFVHSASLGVQHQFSRDFLVEANYFGSRGTRLFQRVDLNPLLFRTDTTPIMYTNPNRGVISEVTNGGFSNYEALQLSATKRLHDGTVWGNLVLTSAYTWSHMIDNASEVFGVGVSDRVPLGLPTDLPSAASQFLSTETQAFDTASPFAQNPTNTRDGEKGNSSFDRRHRLTLSFVWDLPKPAKLKPLFGGWGLSNVLVVQSGAPFSPLNALPISGSLENYRPDIENIHAPADTVALLKTNCPDTTPCGFVTPSGDPVDPSTVRFEQKPAGEFGNAGRNILTGPDTVNLDTSLHKSFSLSERVKLELRGEAFNILNRQNPGNFEGNSFLASDQQSASTVLQPTSADSTPIRTTPGTPARISGFTPENVIGGTTTGGAPFLSQKFLTTSSRRIQWSIRFSF